VRGVQHCIAAGCVAAVLAPASPAAAAVYRFRGTLQVQQTTTWQSSRDDIARGVDPATSTCFGTASGSGVQRLRLSGPVAFAFSDRGSGRRRALWMTEPKNWVPLTATITRSGQMTFSPDPRAGCGAQAARTDGCGTRRYVLPMFPSYLRMYGTRGRDREVLDIYSTRGPEPPPFDASRYTSSEPICPYPQGSQEMPSRLGDANTNLDAAWRVIRIYGSGGSPQIGAEVRPQYLPASRVRNRRIRRFVTRSSFTLRQAFEDPTRYGNPDTGYANVSDQQVNAQTTYTATWTLRRR
jgi:hypothetical protein